ncbi:MAG: 3-phosphoglycerate dehydrogenase family protein [Eubacteriales bacterium]|nr:3-phosphoglycerate dehydrogenase family protein [Clostridiales bacterium]MDD7774228.1 3-phosphoglycerate dehydrogenase family protein [Eubacteriales bacterium]MDY3940646.1 3-phosphoglycerate dehydrogenase family protein [Eubacteriales bacterium]
MNKIKLMNKIAPVGIGQFDPNGYAISADMDAADAIMVRSAVMHEYPMNPELKAIARCGAGVNNIPVDRCAEEGIVVFNTPGANANGVKELTIAALLLASRNIVGGVNWANTLTENVAKSVEAGKSAYAGCEIEGKTLGVIGLGAIGGMVANAAKALGMNVIGCDPYITIEAAWHLSRSIQKAATYEEVFQKADYITLHVPATKETKNMINAGSIAMMKNGVRIINLSRADLVCAADLKAALEDGSVAAYVTDFPTEEVINTPGIVAIPHLGASTVESEDNCAVMAAHELIDYLENGNIANSVNYPSVSMPRTADHRLVILHKNIPNMISVISSTLAKENINIENMANRSKGDYACTLIDTANEVSAAAIESILAAEGIIRVLTVF